MTLHIWCNDCLEWVHEVMIDENDIVCVCGNKLLIEMDEKSQKKTRIELAKAIWGL